MRLPLIGLMALSACGGRIAGEGDVCASEPCLSSSTLDAGRRGGGSKPREPSSGSGFEDAGDGPSPPSVSTEPGAVFGPLDIETACLGSNQNLIFLQGSYLRVHGYPDFSLRGQPRWGADLGFIGDKLVGAAVFAFTPGMTIESHFSTAMLEAPFEAHTVYENARSAYRMTEGHPAIAIQLHWPCREPEGRFHVLDFAYRRTGRERGEFTIDTLTVAFEQTCKIENYYVRGCVHYSAHSVP
jgi:hypothetical protein